MNQISRTRINFYPIVLSTRAYATGLRLSSMSVRIRYDTIVAKRYVLEQTLLLTAYRKLYMRNRFVPKWMTFDL